MSAGTRASAAANTRVVSDPTCVNMDQTMPPAAAEVPARSTEIGQLHSRVLDVTVSFPAGSTARDVLDVIRAVGCPYCKVQAGKYCHDPRTGTASRVHTTRVRAATRRRRRGAR